MNEDIILCSTHNNFSDVDFFLYRTASSEYCVTLEKQWLIKICLKILKFRAIGISIFYILSWVMFHTLSNINYMSFFLRCIKFDEENHIKSFKLCIIIIIIITVLSLKEKKQTNKKIKENDFVLGIIFG